MRDYIRLMFNQRFRQVFFLFLSFGFQFWWQGKKKRFQSQESTTEQYKKIYRSQAQSFTNTAIELQGLLIKLGQFFSSRVDLLPKEYTDELAALQDAVKPVDTKRIISRIESEHKKKLDSIFMRFSEEPLAAASLGQVHAATLVTGEDVAVKILRPGIEETVAIDLKTIKIILTVAKRFTKLAQSVDLDEVYIEFNETINDELDYVKEGKSAEEFQRNFSDDSRIYVPKIYWEFTSKKMLVMEYINGVKITEFYFLQGREVANGLAEAIFSSYLKQILIDGFFHADPHPGNLLVTKDGTLVFIDFGMMGYVDKEMKDNMVKLVLALFKRDAGAVVEAFDGVGFLRPHADRSVLIKSVKLMLNRFIGEEASIENLDINELAIEMRELMYSQPFQIPARTTFLGKALITLTGICNGLDKDFDVVEVSKPYISNLLPGMSGDKKDSSGLLFDQAKNISLEVIALPEKINRAITGLETGELRIHPSKSFENNLIEQHTVLANRIVKAIIAVGLGVVGAILYTGNSPDVGLVLLVVSGVVGLTVFRGRMFSKTSRRRRHGAGPDFKKPKIHP